MNRCPDKTQWVLYAADELPTRERRALQDHLDTCEACRRELEAVARGLSALDALGTAPAVRPAALETLRRRLAVAAAHKATRPGILARLYRARWVAAAAIIVVAALVYSFFPPSTPPKPRKPS